MGKKGISIVNLNVKDLIEKLNKALADEWLAYYQYWIGSKVVKGPIMEITIKELVEHANEELNHANMLVERILQLGGTPILNPSEWVKSTNCGYDAPKNFQDRAIIEQNIKGERCAIEVYQKLAEMTKDKDLVSYAMVLEILKDEVKHEEDLENLLES